MSDSKTEERHLIVEFTAAPGNRDRVRGLLMEFIGPARQEAGCLYYDLYEKKDEPDTFFILDGWANEAAVAGHGKHPNVKRVVEVLIPLLAGPPKFTTNTRVSDPA